MNAYSKLGIGLLVFAQLGCATSMKSQIVRNTALAAAAGAAYGNSREEYKSTHATMYGASLGLIAAIASVYWYDPDKEIESARKQSKELAKSFDTFSEGVGTIGTRGKMSRSGSATKNFSSVPERYKNFVTPGEWVLREIDEYERIDENTIVHKDQIFELTPAQINER